MVQKDLREPIGIDCGRVKIRAQGLDGRTKVSRKYPWED